MTAIDTTSDESAGVIIHAHVAMLIMREVVEEHLQGAPESAADEITMWPIRQGRLLVTLNAPGNDVPMWVAVEAWPPA
jgi:hypothetical protein